jgi:hypothetical protein
MRLTSIFAIALICSSVFAMSKVDMCMYDKVTAMSAEGQKLAFRLTKTTVNSTFSSSTSVAYGKVQWSHHTTWETVDHNEYILSSGNGKHQINTSSSWVVSHGGWNKVCRSMIKKCHNKQGLQFCRTWAKSCKQHNQTWTWTVGHGVVVINKPVSNKFRKAPYAVKVGLGNKRKCTAFERNPVKKVCVRWVKSAKIYKRRGGKRARRFRRRFGRGRKLRRRRRGGVKHQH